MLKIDYSSIDFDSIKRLKGVLATNYIYLNDDKLYKIFNEKRLLLEEIESINSKIDLFDKIKDLDFLIIPNRKIMDNNNLKGIETKYLKNSLTLNDYIFKNGITKSLENIYDASKKLCKMHNNEAKIIVGDMHFDNILVSNGKNYYIDTEGYGIYGTKPIFIPAVTNTFYDWMNYKLETDKNMDKVSFWLAFFGSIFEKNVISVGEYTYDTYAEKIEILKQIKDIYLDLKYTYNLIPDMPYFSEVISESDIKKYQKNMD